MLASSLYKDIAWKGTGQGSNHSWKHTSSQEYGVRCQHSDWAFVLFKSLHRMSQNQMGEEIWLEPAAKAAWESPGRMMGLDPVGVQTGL